MTAKRIDGAVVKNGTESASPLIIACGTFIWLIFYVVLCCEDEMVRVGILHRHALLV